MKTGVDMRTFTHRVDSDDIITEVNTEWLAFAVENGTPALDRDAVVGSLLWDHIRDKETRHVFRVILQRVRSAHNKVTIPFRCDSPGLCRFMEMDITASGEGGVEFNCRVLRTVARKPMMLLDNEAPRTDEFMTMCSWCKQVKVGTDVWIEVEDAVEKLDLFDSSHLPQVTHGICPACDQLFLKKTRAAVR